MSRFTNRAKELFSAVKKGDPVPRVDRSTNAESLWPASVEDEADKAASILRSFFCDGFIVPYRTLATCEQQIIRKCHGIAVFHILRDSLSSPVASGSGVVVARLPDGKWSGASTILVDNKASFPSDVDVLDVVLVINTKQGMEALLDSVVSLQKCLTVVPGPIPNQSSSKTALQASAWSYAKSKGELVDIDLSGLVIREATDENARFYGIPGIAGREILLGQAKTPSGVADHLPKTLSVLDQQGGNLSGLPKPGKCPGDRRLKASSSAA